jgi:hypothetical protein
VQDGRDECDILVLVNPMMVIITVMYLTFMTALFHDHCAHAVHDGQNDSVAHECLNNCDAQDFCEILATVTCVKFMMACMALYRTLLNF